MDMLIARATNCVFLGYSRLKKAINSISKVKKVFHVHWCYLFWRDSFLLSLYRRTCLLTTSATYPLFSICSILQKKINLIHQQIVLLQFFHPLSIPNNKYKYLTTSFTNICRVTWFMSFTIRQPYRKDY